MKLFFFISTLLLVLHLNANTITLKKVANITNEIVMVSDLTESFKGNQADFEDIKNIVVSVLPFEKRMINIPANLVLQKINAQYPKLNIKIPSTVVAVRWNELKLNEEIVKKEIGSFLIREFNLSNEAKFTFQKVPVITIPNENVQLSFEIARSTIITQYTKVSGKVEYGRNLLGVFSVDVRIEDNRKVYQANRSIKKSEVINLDDFTIVQVNVNPINLLKAELSSEDTYIAKNFISKGSFLKTTDIEPIPDIKSNNTVTVLVQTNSMLLTYQAISKTNGRLGDKIMLQNPDSKKIFYAEVIDKNKVHINLED